MRDEALEAAFARRDATAYERAYQQFGARMYTSALRVLRDKELAHDCVHDVLLHLWRKGTSYSPARGNLEAFLVVCVRNAALTRARDDARRRALLAEQPPPATSTLDADPFEHAHVTEALSKLSETQAKTIQLAYYRGMTHTEIAAALSEPVGTIKSRISNALRTLRDALGKESLR
ncbi:MAG: sigma-70 family RNA polymerase sigma factor [Candidatus Eremiobacteraeota bacterium]|nr:sigma-70 family RNA polymerase sigma factor [Candidatus Eremiobacteraeota bacterium]